MFSLEKYPVTIKAYLSILLINVIIKKSKKKTAQIGRFYYQ